MGISSQDIRSSPRGDLIWEKDTAQGYVEFLRDRWYLVGLKSFFMIYIQEQKSEKDVM